MIVYGIDPGVNAANTGFVSLDVNTGQLSVAAQLATLPNPIPAGLTVTAAAPLAQAVAQEICKKGLLPLAVDAPLTCADLGKKRREWETFYSGAFPTPHHSVSKSTAWYRIVILWCRVAVELANSGITIWTGGRLGRKSLVEVFPRASWTCLRCHVGLTQPFGYSRAVGWRDTALVNAGLSWSSPLTSVHERDAAVAALTLRYVQQGQGCYLGRPTSPPVAPAMTGGGIALF